jgi:hypothetical protein
LAARRLAVLGGAVTTCVNAALPERAALDELRQAVEAF